MKVKKRVRVTRTSDAEIINVKRNPSSLRLSKFPCTACGAKLGNRPWGLAFASIDGNERGMRLCEGCLMLAEQETMP